MFKRITECSGINLVIYSFCLAVTLFQTVGSKEMSDSASQIVASE